MRKSMEIEPVSDGFTARCIFFVSPFLFALMIFLVFDVLILDGSMHTYTVFTMDSYSYCSCSETHAELLYSTPFTNEDFKCISTCVNNNTCIYTVTEYSDPIAGTGTCHFYGPTNCTIKVCIDPFLVSGGLQHSVLSIKRLEDKVKKL